MATLLEPGQRIDVVQLDGLVSFLSICCVPYDNALLIPQLLETLSYLISFSPSGPLKDCQTLSRVLATNGHWLSPWTC
jgi:hypothetical protein